MLESVLLLVHILQNNHHKRNKNVPTQTNERVTAQAYHGVLHEHVRRVRVHGPTVRAVHGLRVPVDGADVCGDRLLRAFR